MTATKEFKEWYDKRYPLHPMNRIFDLLPFEFQEGVYRAYFKEKGIEINIISSVRDKDECYGRATKSGLTVMELDFEPNHPEAFEALVNKLFEL